jgi:predicted lipoprotein with Yx(FWY)xxD motif
MESSRRTGHRRRIPGRSALVSVLALVGVLAMTAFAIAKSATVGVGTATVKGHKASVATNAKGVTVYELTPETTKHLLCTPGMCFSFWPPVKAGTKVTKAAGVKGKLGTFKRKGFSQVTLNGHPLYTFAEDGGKKGSAVGEGLHGFGGVWHVFKEG